jgi:hypothetical protein
MPGRERTTRNYGTKGTGAAAGNPPAGDRRRPARGVRLNPPLPRAPGRRLKRPRAPGAPRRPDREGQVSPRKLLYIPVVHTQADLGALREAVAREAQRKLGPRGWQLKVRAVEQVWTEIEWVLKGLKLSYDQVRLYQDGLPVCGREAAIVAELARAGSRNHQILESLMAKGATLMGTESWDLLQEEYRLARESLASACPTGAPAPAAARPPGESLDVLQRRDRFMAQRINDTLKEGETAILFVGRLHAVDRHLDKDIRVIYPCRWRG